MEDLNLSLKEYNNQLSLVTEALKTASSDERDSLLTLKTDLQELIELTKESLNSNQTSQSEKEITVTQTDQIKEIKKDDLDEEYALFMEEMSKSGAYKCDNKKDQGECSKYINHQDESDDSDIEDELASLLGMKCAVSHTPKWGGQPVLHNAMVCALVPRQDTDEFKDLQVRVLFTHPTHAEMIPCPFFLDGECKFSDELCRYSHGSLIQLSDLKEAIVPDFHSIEECSRILIKIKPPENEDINLTKKSMEKYHLWHKAIVKSVDLDKKTCVSILECGSKAGDKRKSNGAIEYHNTFEEIVPLNSTCDEDGEDTSSDELSDTEYPEMKSMKSVDEIQDLLIQKSLENNAPAIGGWEIHTRGIGSRLMLAMGYVPGTGLGACGAGRLQPVEARQLPVGKSLDHCMAITEKAKQDPLKVEQRLKRLQRKEEERNKRSYEREKEKERRNVFNFLNKTLGDKTEEQKVSSQIDYKQSTSKDLNIEQFKITEDIRKLEREIIKLNTSLTKYPQDSNGYKSISLQILDKNKELSSLRKREKQINKEQTQRRDKEKLTIF